MKILGIDPGYDRIGIAILDKPVKGKEKVLFSSCLQTSAKESIYDRFKKIGIEISRVLEKYTPDQAAIENLFITKNQKTAMRVAEARGIIIYEIIKHGVPISEYSPMQIKTAITGSGKSDKDHMIKMVHMLVPLPSKNTPDDEFDAIAVALTHSAYCRENIY